MLPALSWLINLGSNHATGMPCYQTAKENRQGAPLRLYLLLKANFEENTLDATAIEDQFHMAYHQPSLSMYAAMEQLLKGAPNVLIAFNHQQFTEVCDFYFLWS